MREGCTEGGREARESERQRQRREREIPNCLHSIVCYHLMYLYVSSLTSVFKVYAMNINKVEE